MKNIVLLLFLAIGIRSSAQDLLTIESDFLRTTDSILVYKPFLSQKQQYPVLFLLHGHSANYRSWSSLTNLQSISEQYQFIIVCPDGLKKSWYINSPDKDGIQFEDFFTEELIPTIRQKYQVDTSNFFITGASMGGFGAMHIFFKHPGLFLSAGSTSGVLNLRHSGFKKTTLADILGPYSEDNKNFDKYSPVNRLHEIKDLNKHLIVDCGTEDYLYKANNQFREKCDELNIKATYITQPGGHTGGYWSKTIHQHMSFFANLTNEKAAQN